MNNTDENNSKINDISYKYIPVSVYDVKPIGKNGIRGKQHHEKKSSRATYSPFPLDVAEWCAEYHLRDTSIIFDPFAGWGERHNAIKKSNKTYIGYDISEKAIQNAKEKYNVYNFLANSLIDEIPEHDGLLTCPPYWNLEKYNNKDGLDRIKDWNTFLKEYEILWKRVVKKALPGAKYCIMVGDWRKNHKFYDFTYQTEKILERCGMIPFDKIILSYKKISPIKIMLPQTKRLGYTVKVHQYLLIYKKK
jgi:DNA modification methylase